MFCLIRLQYDITPPHFEHDVRDLADQSAYERHVIHAFSPGDGFVPLRLLVNDVSGKENVCVLSEDCRQWKVFDLEQTRGGAELMTADSRSSEKDDGGEDEPESMLID